MLEDNELQWAWVAGLFEGEGCVGKYGRNSWLAVEMKDKDILERLQQITGFGTIRFKPARGKCAETYVWAVQNKAGLT